MNLAELYRITTINRWVRKYSASYFSGDKVWLICVKGQNMDTWPGYMKYTGLPMSLKLLGLTRGYGLFTKFQCLLAKEDIQYKLVRRNDGHEYFWFQSEADCIRAIVQYVELKYDYYRSDRHENGIRI